MAKTIKLDISYKQVQEGTVHHEINRDDFLEWSGGERPTDALLKNYIEDEDTYWEAGFDEEEEVIYEVTEVEVVKDKDK